MTGWEQGENTVMYDVLPSQKFTVKFLGFRWISNSLSSQFPSIGLMSTRADVRTRNDTGRPNSSPFTSLPAYFAVYFGCERMIKIPVSDPESDRVNCRLALETECGSACSDVPEGTIWVNEDKCTLTVYPFETVGYKPDQFYRITLVVEDFPDFPISLGPEIFTHKDSLSAIHFQISIRVTVGVCDGHNAPRFVSPTVPNFANAHYTEYDILRRQPFSTLLCIQVAYKENINTTEVMMSGPMNVKYSYSEDDHNRSDVFRVNMTWVSEIPPQIGNQQFCIWAVSEDGFTSEGRCLTSIVGDDADNCYNSRVICENNGTCVNLFMVPQEKCVCQRGYKSGDCSQAVHCYDSPCRNNGTCTETMTGYSCFCRPEYTGVHCEFRIPPCWSSPCLNNDTCLNNQDAPRCLCSSNVTGTYCEQSLISNPEPSTVSMGDNNKMRTIAAVVGSLVAIGLCVTTVLIIWRLCKQNKTHP